MTLAHRPPQAHRGPFAAGPNPAPSRARPSSRLAARRRRRQRKGAMIFLVAVCMVAFLMAAALSINIAWMHLVDTELRSATDLATRAGGEALARGADLDEARQEIKEIASLNLVAGAPLVIDDRDIEFGLARARNGLRYEFVAGGEPVNAVRVGGHRTSSSDSGNVQFPFTPFLERKTFEATKYATATIQERDIAVVVDRSGSMGRRDGGTHPLTGRMMTRMDALKLAVRTFRSVIDQTEGFEKLALVSYASNSTREAELSFGYLAFDALMDSLIPDGMTNIGAGIDDGVQLLADRTKARPVAAPVLVVMTDGQHNQSRDPIRAAQDAMRLLPRLTIHTITFSPGADQRRMRRVADIGKGRHHHASDFEALTDVFEEVARNAGSILIE